MDIWTWIIVVVAILVIAGAVFAMARRARRSGSVLASDAARKGQK